MAELLNQRDTAVFIGSPQSYISQARTQLGPANGGQTPNDYSLRKGIADDMYHQPAYRISGPGGEQHSSPDPVQMQAFQFAPRLGGLPTFFPIGVRAAVTVHDEAGGKREGLRMLLISPARYNAQALRRHTGKDVRERRANPSRRYVPGIPVGA